MGTGTVTGMADPKVVGDRRLGTGMVTATVDPKVSR